MFSVYLFFSSVFGLLGCQILRDNGSLTTNIYRRLQATGCLIAGYVFCTLAYAPLRGLFVYIALVSLIGTAIAMWPKKTVS